MSQLQQIFFVAMIINIGLIIISAIKPKKLLWIIELIYNVLCISISAYVAFHGGGSDPISSCFTGYLFIGIFSVVLCVSGLIYTWRSS